MIRSQLIRISLIRISLIRGAFLPAALLLAATPALADDTMPPAADGQPGLAAGDFQGGHPRLLNIFASWCVPCRVEAPVLADLARAGVEVDGIAIRDHKADLAAFLAANGNPYARIGADDISAVQLAIGSSGVPETFVIDGRGVIRYQHIGDIRPEEVPMMLAKLKEAGE